MLNMFKRSKGRRRQIETEQIIDYLCSDGRLDEFENICRLAYLDPILSAQNHTKIKLGSLT